MTAFFALALVLLAADGPTEREQFPGLLVPANATDIFAPEASVRVRGSSGSWHMATIVELAPNGAKVKAGDIVARFDFSQAKWALEQIENDQKEVDATAESTRLAGDQRLEKLRIDKRRKALEAKLAALNVQRERSVSRKQGSIDRINERIAAFEAEAVAQSLEYAERSVAAQAAFQRRAVAIPREDMATYRFYEKRFKIVAPHDGWVRHAFNGSQRRVVQKGDGIVGGNKILSLAKDSTVSARFFVPEPYIAGLKKGAEVSVVATAGSSVELPAVVTSIDPFPQEMGFLTENNNLPNGREKAFAVMAELRDPPDKLAAGTEVRVKLVTP